MTRSFASLRRLAALSVAISVIASSVVAAQTPAPPGTAQATFLATPAFAKQINGKKIAVTTKDGTTRKGIFTVSSAGLTADGKGPGSPVPFDQVVRVQKVTHRVLTGTIVGFTVTFLPAWVGVRYGKCESVGCSGYGEVAGLSLLYAGIGAAAGAGIGGMVHAAKKSGDVLYDARRSTTTMALAPILSPTRKGLAFSMTWR